MRAFVDFRFGGSLRLIAIDFIPLTQCGNRGAYCMGHRIMLEKGGTMWIRVQRFIKINLYLDHQQLNWQGHWLSYTFLLAQSPKFPNPPKSHRKKRTDRLNNSLHPTDAPKSFYNKKYKQKSFSVKYTLSQHVSFASVQHYILVNSSIKKCRQNQFWNTMGRLSCRTGCSSRLPFLLKQSQRLSLRLLFVVRAFLSSMHWFRVVAQIQFDSPQSIAPENYAAHVKEVLDHVEVTCAWVKDGRKLVAKPDMLIKRRGKSGLLCLNKGWEESRKWIEERAGKLQKVSSITPNLRVDV